MNLIRKLTECTGKPSLVTNGGPVVPQHALGRLSAVGPIPQEILRLLWFSDGPLKNYVRTENTESFEAGPFRFTVSFGPGEPSAIGVNLPVDQRPAVWDSIPDPSYYPAYETLDPAQRRKYLEWLTNVERDIQIGYVFVFYYGLERHLFFGRVDEAFDMVLRLRKSHHNRSFAYYSDAALTASAVFHNRPDLFMKYASAAPGSAAPEVSALFLMAKAALDIAVTAEEIMSMSRKVGFTNHRYITRNPDLFVAALGTLLERDYGQHSIPLSLFPVTEWPKEPEMVVANISFAQEQRTIPVPQLFGCVRFQQAIIALLREAHDMVKAQLKSSPRSKGSQLAKPLDQITQPVERPRLRDGYALFPPFNESQFDRNVDCYNKGICPCCGSSLPSRPEQAAKCPSCGNRIRTRNNFLKGQKGLFSEDELAPLTALAEERARRNFICAVMEGNDLSVEGIRSLQAESRRALEDALLLAIARKAAEHQRNRDMGLCCNAMLSSGQVYRRIGDKSRALARFLQVTFYDVNGCTNAGGIPGSAKFDLQFGDSVAPAVLDWIRELADEQAISETGLRDLFVSTARRIWEPDMPRTPEQAWKLVRQQLREDE